MAAIGDDESDFYGKTGLRDATPQLTGAVPLSAEEGERRLEIHRIRSGNLMPVFTTLVSYNLGRIRNYRRLGGRQYPRVYLQRVST